MSAVVRANPFRAPEEMSFGHRSDAPAFTRADDLGSIPDGLSSDAAVPLAAWDLERNVGHARWTRCRLSPDVAVRGQAITVFECVDCLPNEVAAHPAPPVGMAGSAIMANEDG